MKDLKKTSVFISLILRHKPEAIGISLDEHGWANVDELIEGINKADGYMNAVLETAADNLAARRFYEKFGFVQSVKGASDGYAAYIIDF